MRGHTDAFGKFGVVLVAILICAVPVAAQATLLVDGFEDGDISDWNEEAAGDSDSFTAVNNVSAVGDWSMRIDGTGSLDTIYKGFTNDSHDSAAFYYNTSNSFNSVSFAQGTGGSSSVATIRYNNGEFLANGGGSFQTVTAAEPNIWYRVIINDINYTAETFDVEIRHLNGSLVGSGDDFDFSTAGHSAINTVSVTQSSSVMGWVDHIQVGGVTVGEDTTETSLELEIRNWMPFNSTQDYTVYLNETNTTTGDVNLTDVTEDANVTVYNITNTTGFSEPIVTVNNTTDTLQSYNQTGVVAVNATYDGNTLGNATNVTVGNRNLTNIGIMPPSQWIPSFFGVDDTTGGHNIGSATQWILFIIVVMAAAARMFDNPWAGLGGGMVTAILMWVLTFVGLGVVLATVFSTIFVGLLVLRSRRMSVTTGGT